MIENLLRLAFNLFESFSCVGTKEVSLNYLADVLFLSLVYVLGIILHLFA